MLKIKAILIVTVLSIVFVSRAAEPQQSVKGHLPEWLDEVQTYTMVTVTPDEAKEMNASVNGVWAGFGGNSPILPFPGFVSTVQKVFGKDMESFVDASHEDGLKVVCAINGIEGMKPLREITPDLESMACRDAHGEIATWSSPEEQCIQMCTNNPDWVEWEIEYGKRGIDAGADLVQVDTPQGQAVGYIIKKGGYCPHCMETFRKHLYGKYTPGKLKEKFAITEFKSHEIIERLKDPPDAPTSEMMYRARVRKNPLFHEFLVCQERASYDTRKVLVNRLREHARSSGKKVAFATNAFQLSAANPFGYWIRAIMFADIFDLFAYENSHSPDGIPLQDSRLPRGKWAPIHKLAHAIHHRRAPAVSGAGAMPKFFQGYLDGKPHPTTWFGVLCADAYAGNGAYITYYFEAPAGNTAFREIFWKKATEQFGFVLSHKDHYEGDLRSGSPVAIVFLFNDRGRVIPGVFPSYLGFAQGLIEGNYPFDVVFAGDDDYVKDKLAAEDLRNYTGIIVPSPIDPTENQKRVIKEFVNSGGTLVCQEPERLGFQDEIKLESEFPHLAGTLGYGKGRVLKLKGEVTETWTDDVGSNFFKNYDPTLRTQICRLAEQLGISPVLERDPDGLVSAFPILQPERKRVVVHVVNYDVDYDSDTIRQKRDVTVKAPRPVFIEGDVVCHVYSPGKEEPEQLRAVTSENTVSCTIPRLAIAASVVFTGSG